jgi:hypothetical protein
MKTPYLKYLLHWFLFYFPLECISYNSISRIFLLKIPCEFNSRSLRGIPDTTLCDKVCQWLTTGRLFSPDTQVSSTNKTDRYDKTEILLNGALNTKPNLTENVFHRVQFAFGFCSLAMYIILPHQQIFPFDCFVYILWYFDSLLHT